MATSSKIHLRPEDVGIVNFGNQSQEAAEKASELLQQNHNNHHIYFNDIGFHNHIVHQILSLYGVGAPPSVLQNQYNLNTTYQRPKLPIKEKIIQDMNDQAKFEQFLGNGEYYQDFLSFFQRKIEANKEGWEGVLKEFLWKGDERADDLLVRMLAGLLHPLIHLGCGIEFNQPAIIAEALAEAAVHSNGLSPFYLNAEKEAAKNTTPSTSPTLIELIEEIKANKKLGSSVNWDMPNQMRDGVMVNAFDEMIKYASRWRVDPKGGEEELERKTVEMIQTAVWIAAGAQSPPKQVKFDFFFIHDTNISIFFSTFNNLPFLTLAQKSRLLEWKSRFILLQYVSRGSPVIQPPEFEKYTPKQALSSTTQSTDALWKSIFARAFVREDDGHLVKLIRAVRFGKEASQKFESEPGNEKWVPIKGSTWEKIGNMAIDSVESEGNSWVRGAGFKEAWEGFGDREGVEVELGALKL